MSLTQRLTLALQHSRIMQQHRQEQRDKRQQAVRQIDRLQAGKTKQKIQA